MQNISNSPLTRKIHICYLPDRRSVWGETVPELLKTAQENNSCFDAGTLNQTLRQMLRGQILQHSSHRN